MLLRHPNYYKNLRKLARNRDSHVRPISGCADSDTDQVISPTRATAPSRRAPGPGHKRQASSGNRPRRELQAASVKRQAVQDASSKLQAPSCEEQASSHKRQAP